MATPTTVVSPVFTYTITPGQAPYVLGPYVTLTYGDPNTITGTPVVANANNTTITGNWPGVIPYTVMITPIVGTLKMGPTATEVPVAKKEVSEPAQKATQDMGMVQAELILEKRKCLALQKELDELKATILLDWKSKKQQKCAKRANLQKP